ncbi:hypothetical protein OT109_11230 [Phycisphaeraceae bacterium D3-23]
MPHPSEMHNHKVAAAMPKIVFWLMVIALVGFVGYIVMKPTIERIQGAKAAQELANLRAIHAACLAYAIDHDRALPDHAAQLMGPGVDYLDPANDQHIFRSPFDTDANNAIALAQNEPTPADWYTYGSYRFYPTAGVDDKTITAPHDFILAHGPTHGSPPKITAIFLDGHIEVLSQDELEAFIAEQPELIAVVEVDDEPDW